MFTLSRILTYFNWDCIRTKGLMIRQLTNQGRENEMNFESFFTHNKHLMYLAETILQNLISLANILKYTIILSKMRSGLKITVWFTVLVPVMFVSNENFIY